MAQNEKLFLDGLCGAMQENAENVIAEVRP